jgi:hypothetical protein
LAVDSIDAISSLGVGSVPPLLVVMVLTPL